MVSINNRIYCINCKRINNHKVVHDFKKEYHPKNRPEMQIDFATGIWEILECCGCDTVTFRETWITSEDCCPTVNLYPRRSENYLPIKIYMNVPPNLNLIYREIIDCFNNEIHILCAAGLRALIEAICKEKKIKNGLVKEKEKGGTYKEVRRKILQGKINGMAEKGILTKDHAKTLHQHRSLGNKALHELEMPDYEENKLAIEILEHTLENLYELPPMAKQIKNKRLKRRRKI